MEDFACLHIRLNVSGFSPKVWIMVWNMSEPWRISDDDMPPCGVCVQKELRERLQIIRMVLEQGGHFRGVNRKVGVNSVEVWTVWNHFDV